MIKNIVFDIGNVLAGFVWEEYYRSFGFGEETLLKLAAATVKNRLWYEIDQGVMTTAEIIRGFKDFDPSVAGEIDQVFENIAGILSPYDYARPWIKSLKEQGYQVYIISNISEKVIADCRDALGFLDIVDGAVLSYQVRMQKPDAEIFKGFLDKFRLTASECVFIDDLPSNVAAAAAQGMNGILFENYQQAYRELEMICREA